MERINERLEDSEYEKLELEIRIRKPAKSPTLRMHIWSDRWLWIDIREGQKSGWKWEWSGEGRLSGFDIGKRTVRNLERSVDLMWDDPLDIELSLAEVWSGLLAQGPKDVGGGNGRGNSV